MVDHTSFVVWKVLSSCYYLSSLYHFLINLLTYCRCYYYQPLIQPGRGFCSLAVSMGLYLWTHFFFSQDHWFHFWKLFPGQYRGWGFCTWRYIRRIWQDHQQQEEMRLARCLSLLIFHLEQNNSNFCWIEEKNKQTILDGSVVFWILSNNNTRYYPLWCPWSRFWSSVHRLDRFYWVLSLWFASIFLTDQTLESRVLQVNRSLASLGINRTGESRIVSHPSINHACQNIYERGW